ncbi:DUF1800 family protein [Prosthecobacter sp.]|uniref:DUF1800 family protein n=1 Tax=Prosthecobacter sp. TaxID=1965333 RepID=UPI001DD57F63|nr:DUF1800 family protein [Prosthecobacter sp.]MCB1278622.1 DUF1800 family protein [Prosthecobacter sp.]
MPHRHFWILPLSLVLAFWDSSVGATSITDQIKWPPGQVPVGQTNGPDTLDDIWQGLFNAWAIDPNGDEDKDDCSNIVESIAGTNPFMANDCFKIGNMTIAGNAVVFSVKVEAGKKYRVLSADAPNDPVWTAETLQTPVSGVLEYVPTADLPEVFISIQKPGDTKKFYKLETSDVDTNNDGVSDWVARKLGLNPTSTDSNGDGVSDVDEITQELQSQDVVTVGADNAFASEDGGPPGMLRLRRNRSLLGATITYTLGGSANPGVDFANLSGTVYFAPGSKEAFIAITPQMDSNLEGGELVTVTLTGGTTDSSIPVQIGGTAQASVIINNTTTATGSGLMARYYDNASSTYMHGVNFGEIGTYVYTRSGTSPNYTGVVVIPWNKTPAVQVGNVVRVTFTGGNLNNATYNNLDYVVAAVTPGTNFTLSLAGAGLPSNSSSSCNFSMQSFPHPAVITRVDPTVNNEWGYGTPNGAALAAAAGTTATNVPDNYSATFETYLSPATAGSYRFQLDADDKARVLLDQNGDGIFQDPDEQILEHGWDTAATGSPGDGVADDEVIGTFKISASIPLAVPANASQRYRMRVEHVETTGEARCRLQWSRDGGTFANIPQAEQFTHTDAATYTFSRTNSTTGTATITLNGHGLSNGSQATVAFSSGNLFTPNTSDLAGYSGSYTVANSATNTFTIPVSGTNLPSNVTSATACFLEGRAVSTSTGVLNKTFSNPTFANTPVRIAVDTAVTAGNNGIWGAGTPDVDLVNPDTFTVRWTGQVQPQFTEEYTFVVQADDGCSLWINGQLQELKMFPSANTSGSTYIHDSATGDTIVNYGNSTLKFGSFAVGESVRLDPSSGNLSNATGSTYSYDSTTGDMVVDYSNLANIAAGSFEVGETVEIDPTTGNVNQGQIPYVITAATATTFTVNIGAGLFPSGSGSINVSDISNRVVTAAYVAGTGTYSYTSTTGNTVIDYTALGLPANSFEVGQNVLLDPTSGNLSAQTYTSKAISAATATTFTVNYGTSFTTGTGSIAMVGVDVPIGTGAGQVPASLTGAFVVNYPAGRYASGSLGNMNFDFVNRPLKDWSSNGNERYVRMPMVAGARYDLRLDYWENTGFARCKLSWFSPSQPKQIIPAERLYPTEAPLAPPSHVGSTDVAALVGGPVVIPITVSNGASVSLSGVPPWLIYSGGVLSGTPPANAAGDYQILLTITDANGTSASLINLHVEDAGGKVVREQWDGVAGTSVAAIPTGNVPSSTSELSTLEGPTDAGDDYGARIRGYITAPTTGNYYFWIAASNSAELWISNDDDPINAFKRASVTTGNATPQTWSAEPGQKSPWLALEQGKRYYIEILHKAGTGVGDNLAVGWSKPGENESAPVEIVPGYALSPYIPPASGSSPGTLYVATMLSQSGAVTNGVGSATFRLSEDESYAIVTYTYSGLSGVLTDWHVHNDAFLTHPSSIMYDPNAPPPGSGPLPDNNPPTLTSHKWVIPATVGSMTKAEVVELIKQGKAYVNLHTAMFPAGEIRGNFTLSNGSRTFSPPPPPPAWTDDHTTANAAARFLTQSTFGPSISDIQALQGMASYEAWIDDQFTKAPTPHLPEVIRTEQASAQGGAYDEILTFNSWWRNSITGADQLRQRIAFALSEIHVVSAQGPLDNNALALSYFYDMLLQNAFGNFRDILEGTTLTPTMGRYLDMLRNDKPDQSVGRIPNENYAREIKQLFSIGLYRMWPDGTLMLSEKDSPIDTYTQREIIGFAHVFTGWDYGYDGADHTSLNAVTNWTRQMREVPARHFTGPKRLLNNEVLPGLRTLAGQPLDPYANHISAQQQDAAYKALPAAELDWSHDQLFNHPNVGPFICRQLIQRLVTSHPSRDYLYRVVQKFNDNGSGVRGDMKAVIKAILLDYEARSPDMIDKPAFGKQREPVMRVAAAGRAFRKNGWSGTYAQSSTNSDPRLITITTSSPHGFSGTSNQFLDFTSGSPAPWIGTYSVARTGTNTLTTTANGWAAGTYNIPANSTTCTVTMSNHWLQNGHQVFVEFRDGAANNDAAVDSRVYTLTSASAETGTNGTFTFTVANTSASVRSGNCIIPRFTPGSFTTVSSGLPAPNDRRVTMDTNFNHELNPGDQVQLNFTSGSNPQPVDMVVTVDSVVDVNTWTFLAPGSGTNLGTNQGNNSVYQFPLKSLPLTRSGDVGSRPSTFAMNNTTLDLEQSPLNSPTVFNFFLPEYKYPGALASQGITTPEFQETAETTVIRQANYLYNGIFASGLDIMSSFNNGGNALVMNFENWMPGNATDNALGNASSTGVPWTHNQNLDALINQMNTLLMAGQLSDQAKLVIKNFVATPIESISVASPCTVTTSVPHNLNTGDTICISGVTGGTFSSSLSNTTTTRTITVDSPTTFRLNGTNPVNCTAAPTGLANAHVSVITYNQGSTNPSNTNRRDRIRSILHLILTSPDFTIQR